MSESVEKEETQISGEMNSMRSLSGDCGLFLTGPTAHPLQPAAFQTALYFFVAMLILRLMPPLGFMHSFQLPGFPQIHAFQPLSARIHWSRGSILLSRETSRVNQNLANTTTA